MSNKARINNVLIKIWMTAAVLIVFAAVFSSIFRSLTPFAKQYKKEVEYHLTQLIGQPVSIQNLETGWYWFHPVLKLDHITIKGKESSIHLEKLFIGIHLFKSLIHWRLQTGLLYVNEVRLVARKKGEEWSIDGLATNSQYSFSENVEQLIAVLALQERLIIKNVSLDLFINDKPVIPIRNLNFSIVNRSGTYKIKGTADIDQKKSSRLELLARLVFDPRHYKETKGQIYTSVKNISLSQWQDLIPRSQHFIEKGIGTLALWIDLNQGEVSSVQSHLSLDHLAWHNLSTKKNLFVPQFYANMSWKPDSKGWQFQADHIMLQIGEKKWPENQVLVQFDNTQHTYLLFAKTINIESLLPQISSYWPDLTNTITDIKPHGIFNDVQLVIKNHQPSYLLTRFDQLGWSAKANIPAVTHLSGAIQWEPQEGHLELDSENTSLTIKGYPQHNLTLLNGGIDWKELSNGLRVSIDHLALSQPELTLTMQGVVDGVSKESLGDIRLGLDFSAKNIQQWMPYLPKEHMKIKLFNWLNNDVKRIEQITGSIKINGLAKDFPFDNNNGEFSIVSHAVGGTILITPKWQAIKNIEGYIRLKNRNLEIDIVNGDAQGVPIKQINLRIDDVGNDKENLLLHGIVKGQAQKMLNFILASPLNKRLAKLNMLNLKGMLSTDFKLEIPLYPENDDNLVDGTVLFEHNTISVKHHSMKHMGQIPVEDINGTLAYNEAGVTESHLTGTAFDYPLDIKIHSIKDPEPMTLIAITGQSTVEFLKNKLNLPVLSLLKGMFSINALLKISSNPNDLDSVTFNSDLEGLAINLPEPLGKKYKEKAPLHVKLAFNSDEAFRVRADYNEKISADIFFERTNKNEFELKSGQINLGSNPAVDQKKPGLAVGGTLDGFNLEQWKKIFDQFSKEDTQSGILDKFRDFNLKLNTLFLLQQPFNNLSIKGAVLPNRDWNFNIEQKKVSADLTYHTSKNILSGFVRHLHLEKIKRLSDDVPIKIKPKEIPNLNLRVDDITVGETKVGNLTLKSHSTEDQWTIDYCRIDSTAYQFMINGHWVQKNNSNQTNLQVNLHINDLAQSLQHWNVTPVVTANKGDLQFTGGWPGSIYDFSLASLKGTMSLQLHNGQITHLSPETEEKLGLGKLLSILSLQTIPRRLKLDFSDLSSQGYSFDIFQGDFSVSKGRINTQNSYIDGPVAYASMKGDLDIIRRTYDLNLSISPHITASLPVVATIAGGPIAGLAAWVANKIINHSMQKITGYSYKVSGPWDNPIVQQLSIIKKMIKK